MNPDVIDEINYKRHKNSIPFLLDFISNNKRLYFIDNTPITIEYFNILAKIKVNSPDTSLYKISGFKLQILKIGEFIRFPRNDPAVHEEIRDFFRNNFKMKVYFDTSTYQYRIFFTGYLVKIIHNEERKRISYIIRSSDSSHTQITILMDSIYRIIEFPENK